MRNFAFGVSLCRVLFPEAALTAAIADVFSVGSTKSRPGPQLLRKDEVSCLTTVAITDILSGVRPV